MTNGWGGKRPGAGRKSRRETYANAARQCDEYVAKNVTEITKVLVEKALAGDVKVGMYLLDRTLGRPATAVLPAADDDREAGEPLHQVLEAFAASLPDSALEKLIVLLKTEGVLQADMSAADVLEAEVVPALPNGYASGA